MKFAGFFGGESNLMRSNVAGNFEGFPFKQIVQEVWVGVKFHDP